MQDYFSKAAQKGGTSVFHYRRFSMLWQGFQLMLLVVILSNNIGLTWVAMEATTVLSAFLIISESDSLSLEAMWKYLLVCSVGIGLAFIGTILVVAAGRDNPSGESISSFSSLYLYAENLNPQLMLFAFIFIVVGYGTKAGLAPMHTWLPDAHSQAPTPVSSVFSGVMLNAALFVIMRYLPIVESSMGGSGDAHSVLLLLGFISLLFAAVFIPIQHDVKRLLAYCSVEHIGIIAIGLGLGGLGTTAALLHSLNHSLSKMLAFFSSGSIIHTYGTRDMRKISGVMKRMPVWGGAFLVSMLVLIGVAPFSVFMSEFLIVKAAFDKERYLLFALFMLGTIVIFISMLKYVLDMVFKPGIEVSKSPENVKPADKIIILVCFAALLLAGLWIPPEFLTFLRSAAAIIESGIKL
jgi:hydrogenase-4 component F